MPQICCVPKCRGNYVGEPRVSVFAFPKDVAVTAKWLTNIPRKNFVPNMYHKVCERHFPKGSIIRKISQQGPKTGKLLEVNLQRPHLKENAVPTIFPNCPI